MGKRKKTAHIGVWTDAGTVKALEKRAAELGVPKSIFVENLLRAAVGLPQVEIEPRTPRKYIDRKVVAGAVKGKS